MRLTRPDGQMSLLSYKLHDEDSGGEDPLSKNWTELVTQMRLNFGGCIVGRGGRCRFRRSSGVTENRWKWCFHQSHITDFTLRTIKLPELAFELLKEHRYWQRWKRIAMGDRWIDSDRVFAQGDSTPVHLHSITG